MVKYLFIFISILMFGACGSSNKDSSGGATDSLAANKANNTSGTKASFSAKNEAIHQSLLKEGINSYYRSDTLYVIDKSKKMLAKYFIEGEKNFTTPNKCLDSIYYISEGYKSNLFWISFAGPHIDTDSTSWLVVFDMKTRKEVLNAYNFDFSGASPDNKYVLVLSEVGIGPWYLSVYKDRKEVFTSEYDDALEDDLNKIRFKWSGNSFCYFKALEGDAVPAGKPVLESGHVYIQKHIFVDGKDSTTDVYGTGFHQ